MFAQRRAVVNSWPKVEEEVVELLEVTLRTFPKASRAIARVPG